MSNIKDIVLYRSKDGSVKLDVQFEEETIWLTLNQMTSLFERDKSVISRHLTNIFKTGELLRDSVVAKNATTASDGKVYQVDYYNLDAIISVGYRVNSIRGTEFRIWATSILKQHLIQGYSKNEKRLKALKQTLKLASDVSKRKTLTSDEGTAILQIISEYAYALDLLDDYDHQRVALRKTSKRKTKPITYDEVLKLIEQMRIMFSDSEVFGVEMNDSLNSSINTIMQTFDGKDLYPSIEEKAANLLYFMVKNHSFIDGNKRIAAVVFIRFAEKNNLIYDKEGNKRIADNALVAMTLMIAESRPKEKDVITAMLTNLIVGKLH